MIAIASWAITVILILANVITCKGFDLEGMIGAQDLWNRGFDGLRSMLCFIGV